MGPIFVKRGEVVFLIPDSTIFLNSLKDGRILPSDHLLVKNGPGYEWVPISDVECFDMGENSSNPFDNSATLDDKNIMNRIKVPKFNYKACLLGAAWYVQNNMLRTGLLKLAVLIALLSAIVSAGIILNLSSVNILALTTVVWISLAIRTGLYANRDFNRMLVKNLHENPPAVTHAPIDDRTSEYNPAEDAIFITPTWREKVLN